jgi:hypothetical protein
MSSATALQTLAGLLQSGGAYPLLNPDRIAPSAIYDLQYRMFMVAATFQIHSNPHLLGKRRINAARLKLLQFIAFRPWLLPIIRKWSESQGYAQGSVFSPRQLQRGFLGDDMHERVVDFLVARRILARMNTQLVTDDNAGQLERLYRVGVENSLFTGSLRVLSQLKDITITNHMLEGW